MYVQRALRRVYRELQRLQFQYCLSYIEIPQRTTCYKLEIRGCYDGAAKQPIEKKQQANNL